MPHANIIDNQLVDDDRIPLRDLPFADRMASKFRDQIEQLAAARIQIPPGWHGIFDHALKSLRAVDCPKRNGVEISEIAYGTGSMHIEVYFAPTDKVVRGILNCLTKRSSATCEVCGRVHGSVYRTTSRRTLCAGCHVRVDLVAELDRWLTENGPSRVYRKRPLIEFDSLPLNIRLLIPSGRVRCLRLISDDREIAYVTPETILDQMKAMVLMKRYLDQASGAQAV